MESHNSYLHKWLFWLNVKFVRFIYVVTSAVYPFLLSYGITFKKKMKVKVLVSESCLTLQPLDCSLWGSSILGISQTRILEWVAISFSRGSPEPRDGTQGLNPGLPYWGRFSTLRATREAHSILNTSQFKFWWILGLLLIVLLWTFLHMSLIECVGAHHVTQ